MSYEIELPESTEVGGFISEPGWYHLSIEGVNEEPTKANGEMMDGFAVDVLALAASAESQVGKTKPITFFNPKLSSRDQGEFARKKIARLFLATGLMDDSDKGKSKVFELTDMEGSQFITKMEWDDDDHKYVGISFAEIYHVDDPIVKDVPKDKAALGMIPPTLRKSAGGKPIQERKKGGRGKAAKSKTTTKPSVNIEDL